MDTVSSYDPNEVSLSKYSKAVSNTLTSLSSSSLSGTEPSDTHHWYEEASILYARFIASLFQCPSVPTGTHPGLSSSSLAHFITYALHRTSLPSSGPLAALLLLQRLKTRFPAARGSSGHRLFLSAFMLASKVLFEVTYSNLSWTIVAQKMFSLEEINKMEREMLAYLGWNVSIQCDELVEFEVRICQQYGSEGPDPDS